MFYHLFVRSIGGILKIQSWVPKHVVTGSKPMHIDDALNVLEHEHSKTVAFNVVTIVDEILYRLTMEPSGS